MKLNNRTILITGGSSGIGLEMAERLVEKDNIVIITGRNEANLKAVKDRFPSLHVFQSDVGDTNDIQTLFEKVIERFPKLDTLVNNAGIMRDLNLNDAHSLEDIAYEIDIDLSGPIRMVQQFLPHLKRQRNALIINVSSGLAFVPFPISPIYSAAKAGLHAYTRCLRVQLEGSNVTIVELAPPLTDTPLNRSAFAEKTSGEHGMSVEILIKQAIKAIEAGKTEIRPGQSNILKIASRVAPGFIFKQLSKVGRP